MGMVEQAKEPVFKINIKKLEAGIKDSKKTVDHGSVWHDSG